MAFLVFAMPRSRSYWLSHFLSEPARECDHDPSIFFTGRDNMSKYLQNPDMAAVDTALLRIWPDVVAAAPDAKYAILTRNMADAERSLMREGLSIDQARTVNRRHMQDSMDFLASGVSCEVFSFDMLDTEYGCARVWEYCLDKPFNREKWLAMKNRIIVRDTAAQVSQALGNLAGITAVFGEPS